MQVAIVFPGRTYTLTNEHSACSHGVPVLVTEDGTTYGPWDNVIDNPDARASGGERYHWQMTARAIAAYARDDHPGDAAVAQLVRAYNAIPAA